MSCKCWFKVQKEVALTGEARREGGDRGTQPVSSYPCQFGTWMWWGMSLRKLECEEDTKARHGKVEGESAVEAEGTTRDGGGNAKTSYFEEERRE